MPLSSIIGVMVYGSLPNYEVIKLFETILTIRLYINIRDLKVNNMRIFAKQPSRWRSLGTNCSALLSRKAVIDNVIVF